MEISAKSRTTNFRRAQRLKALAVLGNECVQCGFGDVRALQIDHINGGGAKHRREHGNRKAMYDVLKGSTQYQLLCANCNQIKKMEKGEF